jgi:hypothetical protein
MSSMLISVSIKRKRENNNIVVQFILNLPPITHPKSRKTAIVAKGRRMSRTGQSVRPKIVSKLPTRTPDISPKLSSPKVTRISKAPNAKARISLEFHVEKPLAKNSVSMYLTN